MNKKQKDRWLTIALVGWIGSTTLLAMSGYLGLGFIVGALGWIVMLLPAFAEESDRIKHPDFYKNNKR